jgi:geranylgeranylglycerol-phosphate geranylgeranyltransferase
MKGFLALMRPINAIMASLGTVIGGVIAEENLRGLLFPKLYVAMAVVFLVLMGGNSLNDYFDAEIDKINHPTRPIPSGQVSRSTAKYLAVLFFSAGLIISIFTLNALQFLLAALAVFLLVTYEWKTKAWGLVGNVIISSLVGLIFIYGSLSIGLSYEVIILSTMAFLANLAREIVKDVEDIHGDVDRTTLPKRIGKGLSLVAAAILIIVAVSLSPIPFIFFGWKGLYILFVSISDLVFLISVFFSFTDQTKGQNLIKIGMILGLVAFLVGSSI